MCVLERMPLFQDEPEEQQSLNVPRSTPSRLFAPEPEETPKQRSAKRVKATPATLFGDEPEELEDSESSDDETGPLQSTFNFDFGAMKLFADSRVLTKAQSVSVVGKKKRAYDNTNRAENAAGKKHRPYKDVALDPKRLPMLREKPQCKCDLVKMQVQHEQLLSTTITMSLILGKH